MANIFNNAKKKLDNLVKNIQGNKKAPQPTAEDAMLNAEINRRITKNQTNSEELEILAYMSDYVGEAESSGKEYWYFCLNEDYRTDTDYVDLAQWIFSHNGMQMEKHLSHINDTAETVLRMPIKEAAKYKSVIKSILDRKSFQDDYLLSYHHRDRDERAVERTEQEYERATAKLKLRMDKEKAQIKHISPDMSR